MYTYEELKGFVDHCSRCELCRTRNHSVMGKGNLHSPILFIAEAPGRNEDRDGVPFTGRSGELFDRLLREIEMKREEIYLTNIVKCNPPGNRDPHPNEQEACIPYLNSAFASKDNSLSWKDCGTADHKTRLSDHQRARRFSGAEKYLAYSRISPFGCSAR